MSRVVVRSPELKAGWPQQLCQRHFDDTAGVLHQLYGGKPDRGADEIDQAGDEQRDPPRFVLGH